MTTRQDAQDMLDNVNLATFSKKAIRQLCETVISLHDAVESEVMINMFFSGWLDHDRDRAAQKAILHDASDATLAAIVIVANDMKNIAEVEYDRRGSERSAA